MTLRMNQGYRPMKNGPAEVEGDSPHNRAELAWDPGHYATVTHTYIYILFKKKKKQEYMHIKFQ